MMRPSKTEKSERMPLPSTSKSFAAYSSRQESRDHVPGLWDHRDRLIILALTLLCAFTRLYRIGRANKAQWDESHFGKFGALYVNRTFYHDVHPPAAKLLVALSEVLAGHNGTFNFKGEYPPYVNYVFMRMFNAA
ncbi:Protein O-mannosyltransferase 2, partial [Coemansia sp. RSA 1591]